MQTLPSFGKESLVNPLDPALSTPDALARAFESFTHVAGSLESSYTQLQAEVARLRRELERKNRDLGQSLAENERMRVYLGSVLEGLPCGVLVVDRKLRLQFANPEAKRLLALSQKYSRDPGVPIPESLRRVLGEIIFGAPGLERLWNLETGEEIRSIGVTCALLTEHPASRGELVFTMRDITEQRRLQLECETSRRMQALAEMTALLAHEIRNPLGSLELFAGLISDATRGQKEVSEWMVHLQAGLRALSATVNNVLQFYTQAPPRAVPVNLSKLLMETVEFLQPLALQRAMGINLVKPEAEIWLSADPHRLQQVFFNLTINALRAMSAGGTLTVRVFSFQCGRDHRIQIEFEDQGVGIPPENLEKIFQAGFTTNAATPGLGLAVCRRIVEQHQGTLAVQSVVGEGTTFTLSFPAIERIVESGIAEKALVECPGNA